MSTDKYSITGRYRTVRKNLDALGYKQALSIDCLPLIELLLVDLAQTKESLKHFQSLAKDNIEACSQLQLAVDPYKCDNAKLVQECNQLHLELIEAKEANQRQSNEHKKKIRKLESELSDLQLSFSKNLQRIKQLEIESSNKSKKILELQGKCCKPIVNNVNLAIKKRTTYPLRRPTLETEPLPRASTSSVSFSSSKVEPYIVDFVSMADHRISCLSNEVTKLKEELYISHENVQTLKSQLNTKEKEISRLRTMLEGGRPCTSINKDHCCIRSEKVNGFHRHSHDDELAALQEAKMKLEQQLKEALNKQHDAMAQAMKLAERNEELERELKDVDRLALRVEADCNSTVKENNRRVCRLQEKLEDLMTQVHVLESELTVQRREAQELRADLEACRLEKSSVQRTLEMTLEEKKQMTDKINNLTMMASSLKSELEELRKENESSKTRVRELEQTKEQSRKSVEKPSPTKPVNQKITKPNNCKLKEKEQKAEANARKKLVEKPTPASRSQDKSSDRYEKGSSSKQSPKRCACGKEVGGDSSRSSTERIIQEKNIIIESLQSNIERLEAELDRRNDECAKLSDHHRHDVGKEHDSLWSEICELRAQMSEKEHTISKLLREKKELCQEKFNLENKLLTYQSQQRSSSPCNHCRCRASPSGERRNSSMSNKIERLERDRDEARADVERLICERDALRDRLKLATETHVSEQRRLRDSLAETECRLARVEQERRELLIAQGSRRAALSGLDDTIEDLKDELKRTKQELNEQRTQYFQLRTLQDQTDQALGDVQGQLEQCEKELSSALDRNKNLERQLLQLDNQIKELRQEINSHRSTTAQLDREKDQLLMDLDDKTEKIAALERELDFKDKQIGTMEQQIRDMTHTKEICIDQASDAERQVRSMQLDMENIQRQLHSATMDRENAILENRRLQDDLAAVTCELRNMHKELEAAKVESHDLKRQLQTYVAEVRRAEDLLSKKENERTEMLEHYRSLSLEATMLESNNHSLETEAAEARASLSSARDQIADLERQLADKDCLIRGYEAQITELTQNVACLEIKLQQKSGSEKDSKHEVDTLRDLCMTLEHQKKCLADKLEEAIAEKTKFEMQLSRYKSEQDIFQEQMHCDHKTIDRLEKLLEDARRETMDTKQDSRELEKEVLALKQKICDLQNKLSKETSEFRKTQREAAEYAKQITELRRQVTNERYERVRCQEEAHSERRGSNENDCQNAATNRATKNCQCDTKQLQSKKGARSSQVCAPKSPRVQNKVAGKKSCHETNPTTSVPDKSCCCKAADSSNLFKKPSCTTNGKMLANCQSKVCLCSGKTKIGDIIASCKAIDNKKMKDAQNDCRKTTSSVNFETCKCCGGKKKQNNNVVTPQWIADTLNLMNKLMNEKRKQNTNCANGKEDAIQTQHKNQTNQACGDKKVKVSEETITSQQQSVKYSIIETCSSHCSISTQTLEHAITISDASSPYIMNILSEIQQYAKNIEEYIQTMHESITQNDSPRDQTYVKRRHTVTAIESEKSNRKVRIIEHKKEMDSPIPSCQASEQSLENVAMIENAAYTSTPRKNAIGERQSSAVVPEAHVADCAPTGSEVNPVEREFDEDDVGDYDSDLDTTEYLRLPRRFGVDASSERNVGGGESHENIAMIENASTPQKNATGERQPSDDAPEATTASEDDPMEREFDEDEVADGDSDLDLTEYLQLPRRFGVDKGSERNAGGGESRNNTAGNVRERFDDVRVNMEGIQQKINRLRQDIFEDSENNHTSKDGDL